MKLIRVAIFVLLFSQFAASGQAPSARDVVTPLAVTSFDPVARNNSFQLAVVLNIRQGFHINAREVSADYLIPTDLRPEIPNGFKAGAVSYPKGTLRTFTFSKTPLNVYEGTTIVRMKVTTAADAPLGQQQIALKLRYQACSNEICLPPATQDIQAKFTVVAEAAAAKPAHAEFFKLP